MQIYETNSPVVLVTDFTLVSDKEYDLAHSTNNSVYRLWGAASKYVDRHQWNSLTKVALFECGTNFKIDKTKPKNEQKEQRQKIARMRDMERKNLVEYLLKRKPKLIIVLQSRSASARKNKDIESAEVEGAAGTICWNVFNSPTSMPSLFGTVFRSSLGHVMAIPNPVNYEKVYEELIRRWFNGALAFGNGTPVLECQNKCFLRDDITRGLLRVLASAARGVPISLDLEFASSLGLITVVGLSDGITAVAVPWDNYVPHGSNSVEYGATEEQYALTVQILNIAKEVYMHNGLDADLPQLEERGILTSARPLDTYIMHGIAYRQYRHGLQQAVSQNFLIPPWKDLFKPAGTEKMKKEEPEYWIADPVALKDYNCDDSFYTWHLGQELRTKVGI